MTWELWLVLGVVAVLVVYIVLRLLFVRLIVGGTDKVDYYQDSEK